MKKSKSKLTEVNDRRKFFELPGKPVRFKKELIRIGTYPHPSDPEKSFVVDERRLADWMTAFESSQTKIWVPHRHSMDTRDNAGWVEKLFMENDALWAILRITDPATAESIRQGSIADISLGIEFNFTDSSGTTWPEFIRHVALTLDPYITAQGPFIELSRKEVTMNLENMGEPAPENSPPEQDPSRYAYWDEENGVGYFVIYDAEGNLLPEEAAKALEGLAELDIDDELRKNIRLALLDALWQAGMLSLAQRTPENPSQTAVAEANSTDQTQMSRSLANDWQIKLDSLLASGRITPAVARKLSPLLEQLSTPSIKLEAGNKDAVGAILEALDHLPTTIDFSHRTRLGTMEPPPADGSGELTDLEREMLSKLGIDQQAYLRYRSSE
jgi:hypothetical protein